MAPLYIFLLQMNFTMLLMALAAAWWVMPRLRALPIHDALSIVLFGGAIRYMGTMLLHPALAPSASPDLVAAWGDVAVAVLALAGILTNRAKLPIGKTLAWLYVILGGADMALAFVNGLRSGLWESLTGGWTFVVAVFPAVAVSLVMTLVLLARPSRVARVAVPAAAG